LRRNLDLDSIVLTRNDDGIRSFRAEDVSNEPALEREFFSLAGGIVVGKRRTEWVVRQVQRQAMAINVAVESTRE
jgi:hypothetical protein